MLFAFLLSGTQDSQEVTTLGRDVKEAFLFTSRAASPLCNSKLLEPSVQDGLPIVLGNTQLLINPRMSPSIGFHPLDNMLCAAQV